MSADMPRLNGMHSLGAITAMVVARRRAEVLAKQEAELQHARHKARELAATISFLRKHKPDHPLLDGYSARLSHWQEEVATLEIVVQQLKEME
ncbi:MAG TPA: hypothetical protein VD994_00470 [Prosthecobacter sp.]|nr:hypothetical protein [Prosthecobacter sp.]